MDERGKLGKWEDEVRTVETGVHERGTEERGGREVMMEVREPHEEMK